MKSFSTDWINLISDTITRGDLVTSRGHKTYEVLNRTLTVDMQKPVLMVPERKLSYVFMVAEAYWILTGDNRVETIKPYNSRIADFSDDGQVFFGAYGPKILDQINYVANKLRSDAFTRQAGMTTWRENPPISKDIPCTVGMFFNIRDGLLHCHVFMRSSDVWLGIPYDVFNFSMLSHLVCGLYNEHNHISDMVKPGSLHITAVSSHLYYRDLEHARQVYKNPGDIKACQPTLSSMWQDPAFLLSTLKELKDLPPTTSKRWWLNEQQ